VDFPGVSSDWIIGPAGELIYGPGWHFGFNWPAFIIVMLLTVILVRGIKESAETNNIMGAAEDCGDPGVCGICGAVYQAGALASVRAEWMARDFDGRIDRVFHVHRIRFGFQRRRRSARIRRETCREESSPHSLSARFYILRWWLC